MFDIRVPLGETICLNEGIDPFSTRNPIMGTMANSEDPDEMPHKAAFHQGLHCLLRQN